jgi:hypothetical protein
MYGKKRIIRMLPQLFTRPGRKQNRLAFFDRAVVKAERELGRQAGNPQIHMMLMESYLGEKFAASEAEESGLA